MNDNFANKCAFLQEDGVLKLFESSAKVPNICILDFVILFVFIVNQSPQILRLEILDLEKWLHNSLWHVSEIILLNILSFKIYTCKVVDYPW